MKIVGVTSCTMGVAHTYMAAEALEQEAKKANIEIKVETQGSSGTDNRLTDSEIAAADFVVLSNDTTINGIERFKGKRVVQLNTTQIIEKAPAIIKKLAAQA